MLDQNYSSMLFLIYCHMTLLRDFFGPRLNVPRANKVLGQNVFSVAVPTIWNNLPTVIRESVNLSTFRKDKDSPFSMLIAFKCAMIWVFFSVLTVTKTTTNKQANKQTMAHRYLSRLCVNRCTKCNEF